jgi:hypothetical protein
LGKRTKAAEKLKRERLMFDLHLKKEIDLLKDHIENKKQWSLDDYLRVSQTPLQRANADAIAAKYLI